MRVAREEIFGPVVSVLSFADEEEAISLANGTDYSLAASAWTRDIDRIHRMTDRLDAGRGQHLRPHRRPPAMGAAWAGSPGSGADLGRAALNNYTEQKTIWIYRAG
jgi:acyl-CoA reductase-like NAD-dependent aldehyde dehydrogenase